MIRTAVLLICFVAAPCAAQETGACRDGSQWWAAGTSAGLGPCESPEEGFFRLTCTTSETTLRVFSPYPIAVDQPGTTDLTVDGRRWRLEGIGADDARTGDRILADISIPQEALDALAAGAKARLDMPTETRPFHLTGSGAALTALTDACS